MLLLTGGVVRRDFWFIDVDIRSELRLRLLTEEGVVIDWTKELWVELDENFLLADLNAMYLSGIYLLTRGCPGFSFVWFRSEPCHQSAESWPRIASQLPFLKDNSFSDRPL